jgi:hypothetical protein
MNRSGFTFSSNVESIGDSKDPDIIYYNASIVNNNTDDVAATSEYDPPIRFNETRDTAIVRDASRYQFSIIRFVMNGPNKDLPLFIPAIQSSTGQTNVNLTEYGVGLTWEGTVSGVNINVVIPLQYVIYSPETQNPTLAPLPRSMANPNYRGLFVPGNAYVAGDIVYEITGDRYYKALINVPALSPLTAPFWQLFAPDSGQSQDITSRYYWVYTFSHWVDLVNQTLDAANLALYNALGDYDIGNLTYQNWLTAFPTPILSYSEVTGLFTMSYPATYVGVVTNPIPAAPTLTQGFARLYFNSNMEGLFSGFNNIYLNTPTHPAPYGWVIPAPTPVLYPAGYTNLMLVRYLGLNENVVKTADPIQGYTGNWFKMTQNYESVSTLWSPIDSIVFTSTLLPLQNEQTAPPNSLGTRNTGNSTSTSQSAFSPIITDVSLDLSTDPTGYRKMIYYAPSAEYRMADFQNSKQDIRSIDIQVFWKNRLDNNLYPVSMFNLSNVSFKLMFRKKTATGFKDRQM